MQIRVTGSLSDMARHYRSIPAELGVGVDRVAGSASKDGNDTGKRISRARYGRGHARKYAGTWTSERRRPGRHEFGPVARGQGILAPILERGSRNNPAHHNLDQAADLMTPGLHRSVDSLLDGLFDGG